MSKHESGAGGDIRQDTGAGYPIDLALEGTGEDTGALPESLRGGATASGAGASPPAGAAESESARAVRMSNERLEEQAKAHKANLDRQALRHQIDLTDTILQGGLSAFKADTPENLKFREKVQDLRLDLARGGFGGEVDGVKKDRQWYAGRLQALVDARGQEVLDNGTDGADHLPTMSSRTGDVFDPSRMLAAVRDNILRNPTIELSIDKLDGAPELDYLKEAAKSAFAADRLAKVQAQHKGTPNSLHLPIPVAALQLAADRAELQRAMRLTGMSDLQLAQSYGTDKDGMREPTYRRDMLVPYFRPMGNLEFLGFPMPMIANDVTLPRITGSITAEHYPENGDINPRTITIGTHTTKPHRYGTGDPISWQLLAAADQQFGIQPVVLAEIAAAIADLKEKDIYTGDGNDPNPRGIWHTTGLNDFTITPTGGVEPKFRDMMSGFKEIANDNVPVTNCKWIINPNLMVILASILTFSGTSSFASRPMFEPAPATGQPGGFSPILRGFLTGFPAAVSTQLASTAVASSKALTGGSDHPVLFGDPRWVPCFDYSMGILTIDDISSAQSGQTQIWYNGWNDVHVRLPLAWGRAVYDVAA